MQYREPRRSGWRVSGIHLGTWAIGGARVAVDNGESMASLHDAPGPGSNLSDTAGVPRGVSP